MWMVGLEIVANKSATRRALTRGQGEQMPCPRSSSWESPEEGLPGANKANSGEVDDAL
jgi:hypothetical protein